MSGISMVEIGKMKVGRYIVITGEPHQITSMSKSAPGKHGHAKYRVDAKNIFTGQTSNLVMTAHKYVEVPNLKKQNAQVLSVSGTNAQIMDMETYETFDLEIPEELQGQVESGKTIMYWEIMGKRIMKQMVTLK
jgi:translation initiation factor 5A